MYMYAENITFTPMRIDNRIRRLRKARGWNLDELSARSGVGRATLGAIEKGDSVPRLDTAFMIAQALNRPTESMFHAVRG